MPVNEAAPFWGFLAGGLAVTAAFVGASGATHAVEGPHCVTASFGPTASLASGHHPRELTFLKRRWGVEVMYVRETAAGHMLEFRYRVLDAAKAKPLFERQTKPVLTHAETGAKLIVPSPPTTGALRNSNPPIAGRVYWMFFSNPGKLVRPGQHVNIEIGEFHVDGLVVQ